MALPPHFGGIENEARNCNIYYHRLQITPIKILLHQITRIFRTVVILTNLFRIFACKSSSWVLGLVKFRGAGGDEQHDGSRAWKQGTVCCG